MMKKITRFTFTLAFIVFAMVVSSSALFAAEFYEDVAYDITAEIHYDEHEQDNAYEQHEQIDIQPLWWDPFPCCGCGCSSGDCCGSGACWLCWHPGMFPCCCPPGVCFDSIWCPC